MLTLFCSSSTLSSRPRTSDSSPTRFSSSSTASSRLPTSPVHARLSSSPTFASSSIPSSSSPLRSIASRTACLRRSRSCRRGRARSAARMVRCSPIPLREPANAFRAFRGSEGRRQQQDQGHRVADSCLPAALLDEVRQGQDRARFVSPFFSLGPSLISSFQELLWEPSALSRLENQEPR